MCAKEVTFAVQWLGVVRMGRGLSTPFWGQFGDLFRGSIWGRDLGVHLGAYLKQGHPKRGWVLRLITHFEFAQVLLTKVPASIAWLPLSRSELTVKFFVSFTLLRGLLGCYNVRSCH